MPERGAQRLSAGVVVVRSAPRGPLILMLRAYRNWDFPKGAVEPGEEPLAAAIRETAEESGITDLAFDWGTDFYETRHTAETRSHVTTSRERTRIAWSSE